MDRITNQVLQAKVEYLNELTGSPIETYSTDEEGNTRANIGNFKLSWANGGVTLHRIASSGGGVDMEMSCGYVSKRELAGNIDRFIEGIRFERHNVKNKG